MTRLIHTIQFASPFALTLWASGGGKILRRFDTYALTLGPIAGVAR